MRRDMRLDLTQFRPGAKGREGERVIDSHRKNGANSKTTAACFTFEGDLLHPHRGRVADAGSNRNVHDVAIRTAGMPMVDLEGCTLHFSRKTRSRLATRKHVPWAQNGSDGDGRTITLREMTCRVRAQVGFPQ